MKDRDDDASATGVLTSFLAQQVGGRDWSAQEVAHVTMGYRTIWASHEFDHVTLGAPRRIRTKVNQTTPDEVSATDPNKWDLYLKRCVQLENQMQGKRQTHMADHGYTLQASDGSTVDDINFQHVESCSFTDFWRRYHYVSNGRKGGRKLQLRVDPTIILVKPRMPRQWGKRGSPKRIDYCRIQLQCHMPFADAQAYKSYLYGNHKGDFEAAYEEFATGEHAPACCKDDFREFHIEKDGAQVNNSNDDARMHGDFAMYQVNSAYAEASSRIETSDVDWGARSASTYSADLIGSAARWRSAVAQSAQAPKPVYVDPSKLNEGQAFVHRVVSEHYAKWKAKRGPVAPLRMLICGTAGSGKTFLIRALKQQLGDDCKVFAPTGVAADNIGTLTTSAPPLALLALL